MVDFPASHGWFEPKVDWTWFFESLHGLFWDHILEILVNSVNHITREWKHSRLWNVEGISSLDKLSYIIYSSQFENLKQIYLGMISPEKKSRCEVTYPSCIGGKGLPWPYSKRWWPPKRPWDLSGFVISPWLQLGSKRLQFTPEVNIQRAIENGP